MSTTWHHRGRTSSGSTPRHTPASPTTSRCSPGSTHGITDDSCPHTLAADEDEDTASNQIPTIAVGAGVTRGPDRQKVTHYSLLRTLDDAYGLAHLGRAAEATPVHALVA